jgi:hypothetical protein
MKLPSFFRPKAEADPLEEAIVLHERYGEDAEQWCEIGILATDELERRRTLYRVRELLRTFPAEQMAAYETRC